MVPTGASLAKDNKFEPPPFDNAIPDSDPADSEDDGEA